MAQRASRHQVRVSALLFLAFQLAVAHARAEDPIELAGLDAIYPSLDALYRDLHTNPELSHQETKTAAKLAVRLRAAGFQVTDNVGGNGIVGVLKNGAGPTVLVRADMDALPVKEETGLPYASSVVTKNPAGDTVPVMHACGHDIHMTAWLGAATLLAADKSKWHGTLLFVGQPAEETLNGAQAMVDDGLFVRFPKPDVTLAIHDTAGLASGTIGVIAGAVAAASNGVDITFFGRGGHGAYPNATVDPIVIASRAVVALQTIVSREVSPFDAAVVTVGTFHSGIKRNVIPNEAKIELTVRSFKPEVQAHLLAAIDRIAKAEAAAAAAPREPLVTVGTTSDAAEVLVSDPSVTEFVAAALRKGLGEERVVTDEPMMASEDFGVFGRVAQVPSVHLRVGVVAPEQLAAATKEGRRVPGPHNSKFAPDREPAIRTGVAAYTLATLALLSR